MGFIHQSNNMLTQSEIPACLIKELPDITVEFKYVSFSKYI